jgi:CelD/BcsL family acetyltransferase involved in cellulose biosynthesis
MNPAIINEPLSFAGWTLTGHVWGALPDRLAATWEVWSKNHGCVFQTPLLVESWVRTIGVVAKRGVAIMLEASDTTGLRLLWPIFIEQTPAGIVVKGVGADVQYDYQDPLEIGNPLVVSEWILYWQAFIAWCCARVDRTARIDVRRLTVPVPDAYRTVYVEYAVAPYIDLPSASASPLDAVLAACSYAHRKTVRRKYRAAARLGEVRLDVTLAGRAADALEHFFEMHQSQWAGSSYGSQFERAEERELFKCLMKQDTIGSTVELSCLTIAGQECHWLFGLKHRGIYSWYKPTYLRTCRTLSPGLLHLALLIDSIGRTGIRQIDLGYGEESYKLHWTSRSRVLSALRVPH